MLVESWPVDRVKPYPGNPRKNDKAVDAVAASLREFGWRQALVVDTEDVLIVGHTRLKAAKKLGLTHVPVHVATDLTPEQIKAYRLADNKSAELAEWNPELLTIELTGLKEIGYDLKLAGFDPEEVARIMGESITDGLVDPDDIPEPPDAPVTQPGDLWILGNHRLYCGDSTKLDQVQQLLGGEQANMLFTDPPWNVAIGQDSNPRHRQRPGLKNDSLPPEQFQAFLDGFISVAREVVAGDVYCVLGASEWPRLDSSLRSAGFHWSATVIWVKDVFVLGRSKYHRRYEPIWYGWHKDANSSFVGRRDLDDVWEIARPKRSEEHPTMKPVELAVRAIQSSSVEGGNVLDLFGGSGSTLIAAEQARRKAIDPKYCDVICSRYERFSGKRAERLVGAASA